MLIDISAPNSVDDHMYTVCTILSCIHGMFRVSSGFESSRYRYRLCALLRLWPRCIAGIVSPTTERVPAFPQHRLRSNCGGKKQPGLHTAVRLLPEDAEGALLLREHEHVEERSREEELLSENLICMSKSLFGKVSTSGLRARDLDLLIY